VRIVVIVDADDAPVDDADILADARRAGAVDDRASDNLAIEHQLFSISVGDSMTVRIT
jgi:hypothetical protein